MVIDLVAMQGKILSGRARGRETRREKNIDALERQYDVLLVNFPQTVLAVSSSFFLGMFGPSIMLAGSKQEFLNKFKINVRSSVQTMIDGYVDFALENKNILD